MNKYSPDGLKCLLGAVLVKAGQALLMTWGKSNVYYYSYFKMNDPDLSVAYNTLPIALMGIPLAAASVYSLKIADRIGYEKLIKITTSLQFLSFLLALHANSYLEFIIFYLGFIGLGYALMAFPLLKCLWSHFSEEEGMVTGILFGVFGFATFFYLLLVTYIVNPNNEQATLSMQVGSQQYLYFSEHVAVNTHEAIKYAGFIAGTLSVCGSLLINQRKLEGAEEQELQILTSEIQNIKIASNDPLLQVVRTPQFKIILGSYFTVFFFEVTLGLNYKTYVLQKINNDQLITWVDTLGIILGSIANFVFGKMADSITFTVLLHKLLIMMSIIAVMIPISLNISKDLFIIDYLLLSIVSKGIIVILGPGLLQIFGKKTGADILPIVNFSGLLGFIISALSILLIVPMLRFDGTFIFQGLLIGLAAYSTKKLNQ
ncbi:unnamed protein product (macronuclear) [Paramecium tetraurelia]|uniref:Major facilitator superfamily (MFS) profile domain-containing protein n=1 Tax=Paramecium tetraurelia TaxID=5888 RepID=A0C0Q8_PARTE|nr:uncharacterized protein GSPATT00033851001 [Paramecium tetraurelia]CAK64375.1 unnamed protein product [Paramecium tetraurelia]|eukprot:XP_001431773.1 hypothetical protein (macronuclear) [Paramecium tetraurelia strain d4-2]